MEVGEAPRPLDGAAFEQVPARRSHSALRHIRPPSIHPDSTESAITAGGGVLMVTYTAAQSEMPPSQKKTNKKKCSLARKSHL